MEKLLIVTKKWQNLNEAKFGGRARIIGELSDGEEYLLWDFKGTEEEANTIFGTFLVKCITLKL